jgi:hypothetical protein
MPHPTEGVLRRLLDEPAGVAELDRRHVADCPQCLSELSTGRQDADLVGAALAAPAVDVDVEAAWLRLSADARTDKPPRTVRAARRRGTLRRPAAAALAVAVVLAGAGTAAANDWLQIFRTEQVAPVGITADDLVALPDLSAYGDLAFTAEPDVREVRDAAAAEAETGLDVPQVAGLPRGVRGEPTYQVGGKVSATFTFRTAKATRAAAAAREPLPAPPPGLDGSAVRLDAGPGVAQIWSSGSGAPALVVARAVAPTAFSSGVPFETVRDYLLSLPGLPRDVAEQLRTFAADGSTLPLPVPADEVTTRSVEVDGAPATVLVTRDRFLAGVVWVEDGLLTVVAGALDDSEVLSVARDLR